MEIFYKIVALLGGLSMFLYGMRMMGDALKSSSGGAMKAALAKVTNRPVVGFLFGMLVTCMIQSSTATIVLTIGLVGAGFLTFRQSVGIVLGANVGTAITAQIIRLMDVSAGSTSLLYFFKADNLAPMALCIGIVFIMFIKKESISHAGNVLIGFGILFMGLIYMSEAVSEMGTSVTGLLTAFEGNYLLGFLAGVVVTGVIQSSSAVVGILQTMASSVGLSFCGVFSVIIGVNIGDCLTTYLVSRIGAKTDQIRTAVVHIIYNVIAALMIFAAIFVGRKTGLISDELWNMQLSSGGVANVHGIFRLVPAVLLLPFSNRIASLAEKLIRDVPADPEDAEIEEQLRQLDVRLLDNPALALDQAGQLIIHMSDVVVKNYRSVTEQRTDFSPKRKERIEAREELLDRMTDAANQYLVDMSPFITRDVDGRRQDLNIKAITGLERIGDMVINISYDLANLREKGLTFSDAARSDLSIAEKAVGDILKMACEVYSRTDLDMARKVDPLEEVIDDLIDALKSRHIDRMIRRECDIYAGIQYENILTNLERISDRCSDLAIAVLRCADPQLVGDEHQYVHELHRRQDPVYRETFREFHEQYFSLLSKSAPGTAEPENAQ